MKINELLKLDFEFDENQFGLGGISMGKIFNKYSEEDCVVAYNKNKASIIFIIKTARTYMGFYRFSDVLRGDVSHTLRRIDLNQSVKLIENEGVIVDEDEFTKVKRKIILNNLK